MTQTLSKINTSDFLGFLEDIFNIAKLQKVEAIHTDKLESLAVDGFDFNNIVFFGTSSNFGEFLEAKTGHKNLVFSFVKMTQAKEAKKQELYKATIAINRAISSYNIIFFYNQTHLHIAFAKRRLHKNRTIKEDVLEKISIIKDVNLKKPSQAHLKNLKSLNDVASHQEINVYYDKILEALSVKNLNEAFYRDILECFKDFVDSIKLPNETDSKKAEDAKREFTLRLISRILFCKFLEKKGLIDEEIWKIKSDKYYHNVLEPLFFGTLNTAKQNRKYDSIPENIVSLLKEIPYLNGGLFNPQNDYYNTDNPLANINTLTVPNEPINKLFETLDKYHFTIDEGSLKYEEIALDPELLGRIFESLLSELFTDNKREKLDKQSIRKATGSFYTPREIVSYMVKESLKLHLQKSASEQILASLFDEAEQNEAEQVQISPQDKAAILQSLKNVKILDPACGSGAFPMGILNEMLEIYEKLKDERKTYEIKKEILQNCIYGIDIQPMAIEISRLRAFLSLIIDEENDKIEPLPNLDFKFISANSLIKLNSSKERDGRQLDSDIYEKCFKELKKIREETFKSNCDKKSLQERYKNQITILKNGVTFNEENIDALVNYDPFDSQSVAEFFDSEFMFGVKNFDIIIGNPPYGAKINEEQKKIYKSLFKYTIYGTMDTYKLFIEKGFDLLKTNGSLNYIVPMSITSSISNTDLHKMLFENCETIWISNYGYRPNQIFGNAAINVSIISFIKSNTPIKNIFTTKINKRYKEQQTQDLIDNLKFVNSLNFLKQGRIPKISYQIEANILNKIYSIKTTIENSLGKSKNVKPIYYRTSGGLYYKIVTSFSTNSSKETAIFIQSKYSKLVGAIMSSTLYYWRWLINSNWLDMRSYEILDFPIPIDKFTDNKIEEIEKNYKEYEEDLLKNSKPYRSKGEPAYYARLSKHIIDKIDRLICPLYGLNEEETEFIINYDLEFRV